MNSLDWDKLTRKEEIQFAHYVRWIVWLEDAIRPRRKMLMAAKSEIEYNKENQNDVD